MCIRDSIYDGIEFVAPCTLPGMWERTLPVCSISKGIGLSGFRIGYIYACDKIMDVLYGGAVNVLGAACTQMCIRDRYSGTGTVLPPSSFGLRNLLG